MQEVKVLRDAKALLQQGWCKGTAARNADGDRVTAEDPSACQWCLTGAINRACGGELEAYDNTTRILRQCLGLMYLPDWNDHPYRKHEEVLEIIDVAIVCAERKATLQKEPQ